MTLKSNLKKMLLTAALFAAAIIIFVLSPERIFADGETAADNVYVENICVAGMNEEQINQVVQQKLTEYGADTIKINVGEQSAEVPVSNLGLYQINSDIASKVLSIGNTGNVWERFMTGRELSEGAQVVFEIETAVNEDSVRSVVRENCVALNVERADMTLVMSDGVLQTSEKQDGISVDVEKTVSEICEYMDGEWFGGYGEIDAVVTIDEAQGDESTFANTKDILGSGTTLYAVDGAEARASNIANATSKINGTVLYPGEEFSVVDTLTPFSAEEGYELAPSFEMGEVVDTYGGGACQVSSTLYRAVLESELEVTERHEHSMMVSYVDPSLDAAVSEGVKDFKFVNNTDYPIYIEGYTGGGSLTFNIYGCEMRDQGRTLEFYGEIVGTAESSKVYELDSSMSYGSVSESGGSEGAVAVAMKVVYQDGVEVSREQINSSEYNAKDNIVYIGTDGATQQQIWDLQSAVDSQSYDAIAAIIGAF